MYSFNTSEGRSNIFNFLGQVYSGKLVDKTEAEQFLKCMLRFKQYDGILIGIKALIDDDEYPVIKHCLKKYLNKPGYLDINSKYARELATFITCLGSIDDDFINLASYAKQIMNDYEDNVPQRFGTYNDFLVSTKPQPLF